MLKISAYTALAFGLFLAIAEAYRNWGYWQWWPFWAVDYAAAFLLIIGAVMVLRGGPKHWLAGGWGFTSAMFYMSFFSHVERLRLEAGRTYGPDGSLSEDSLTQAIGIMLLIALLGFASSLPCQSEALAALRRRFSGLIRRQIFAQAGGGLRLHLRFI